ncbi:InlB B-repeat-containing protein [Bifidobacterium panos]|uniref:Listeria-Bacteroides repeat domain n=1 Tax=Bifidobacterium panos TaxID=2675321 RepID=A0ABX1SXM3_9BIFI|nr:InlB B-repeat-containing protein [Bifidobacterium sp. DSM 109963]NMN02598.1 Listeria-Bacteroides repeat domain [Bifidobacterium sp. DSM 109963]
MMRHLSQDGLKRRGVVQRVLLMLVAVAMVVPLTLVAGRASAATKVLGDELICSYDEGTLEAKITQYVPSTTTGKDIEIPATIDYNGKTYTITEIGDSVFAGQQLTTVSFAADSKITKIGDNAFQTNSFTSMSLPDTVTTLDSNVFNNCSQMTSIGLPAALTTIGADVFGGCGKLASVDLPATLETIGNGAFYGCGSLTSVDFSNTKVTVIPANAFRNSGVQNVTLNDKTTTIGSYAFSNAQVTELKVPSTIQSIGDSAFYGYSGPKHIVIDHVPDSTILKGSLSAHNGVVEWKDTGVAAVDNSCFYFDQNTGAILGLKESGHDNCAHSEYHQANASLVIPAQIGGKDVTSIFAGTFCNANRLNIVDLSFEDGSKVTTIGNDAFQFTGLKSVSLPDSLTTINSGAFQNCNSLKSVSLPDSLITIGSAAFAYCGSLSEVSIPDSVTSIGIGAFNAAAMKKIDIHTKLKGSIPGSPWGAQYASVVWKDETEDPQIVTAFGADGSKWYYNAVSKQLISYLGDAGTGEQDLTVPSVVMWTSADGTSQTGSPISIGVSAVQSKGSFKSVTVPGSITSIQKNAFTYTTIGSLSLGEGIQAIADSVFVSCGLTEVTLPQSVTSIAASAFTNNSLTEVTIPQKVDYLAVNAFSNNPNLSMITVDQCRLNATADYRESPKNVKNNLPWGAPSTVSVFFKDDPAPVIVPDTEANNALGQSTDDMAKLDTDFSHGVVVDSTNNTATVKVISRMNTTGKSTLLESLTVDNGEDATGGATQTDSGAWLHGSKTFTQNGHATFVSTFKDSEGKTKSLTQLVEVTSFHNVTYDANAPKGQSVTGQAPTDSTGYVEGYKFKAADSNGMKVLSAGVEAYTFEGWNTKADGSGTTYKAGADVPMTADNMTLYAVWKVKDAVDFTLDANGGMFDATASKTTLKVSGTPALSLNTATGYKEPTRDGYVFKGWSAEKAATEPSTVLPIDEGKTYYAVWAKATDITVTFDANGGKLADGAKDSYTGTYDAALAAPSVTRTGYTLAKDNNWNTSADGTGTKFAGKYPAKSTTYRAVWTPNSNTVTFTKGAHGDLTGTAAFKDAVKSDQSLADAKVTAPTVKEDAGWTFTGWMSSENDLVYSAEAVKAYVVSGANGTVTFEAQYVANEKCTVVFNANGGQIDNQGKDAVVSMSDSKGKAYVVPTVLERTDGYSFGGWSLDGKTAVNPQPSGTYDTDGVTVYTALWNADTIRDITFDATDKGSLDTGVKASLSVKTGDALSTAAEGYVKASATATAGNGWKFTGWKANDGTKYTPDQIASVKARPGLKFTAEYEKLPDMTVVFDYNGGTLDGKSSSSLTGTQDTAYTLDDVPVPTRNGYSLDGWTKDGETVVDLSMKYENVTYKAKWSATHNQITFTVNEADGQQTAGKSLLTVDTDQPMSKAAEGYEKPTVSPVDGRKFLGWRASVNDEPGALYQPEDIADLVSEPGLKFVAEFDDQPTVTATFDYNGGKVGEESSSSVTDKLNLTAAVPAPTRDGYKLAGWTATPSSAGDLAEGATEVKLLSNVTYTAKWDAQSVDVSFNVGDNGSLTTGAQAKLSVLAGSRLDSAAGYAEPLVTANSGWRFTGWKSSADGRLYQPSQIAGLAAEPGLTFTAEYVELGSVDVVFNYNGGRNAAGESSVTISGKENTAYKDADKAKADEEPTRTGYSFKGWDKTPSGKYESVTYVAQWTALESTAMFMAGDHGTLEGTAVYTVKTGSPVGGKPEAKPSEGWRFVGWRCSEDNRLYAQDSVDKYVVTGAKGQQITFTAEYVALSDVQVHFNYAGGLDAAGATSGTLSGQEGTAYAKDQIPTPTRTGYTFDGWNEDPSLKYESKTYTAKWKVNANTVTFEQGDHGTLDGTAQYTVNSGDKVSGEPTAKAADGYTFTGWLCSEDQKVYAADGVKDKYVVTGANPQVTFTAQYEENKGAKVVFNANGGLVNGKSTDTLTGTAGTKYATPADPSRDGYTFDGWLDADGKEPTNTYAEGTAVYTAQWIATANTVTFAQGDHGTIPETAPYQVATDARLTDVTAPEATAEAGWSFDGWESAEFGLVSSEQLAELVMPAHAVTFTAHYVQNPTGTVMFLANGGLIDGQDTVTLSGPLGTGYEAPVEPTREGWTFDGWDTKVSGTFDQAVLVVSAKWAEAKNTLVFAEGEHGALTGTKEYQVATNANLTGAGVKAPTVEPATGYEFLGWQSDQFGLVTTDQLSTLVMPAGNVTMTAQYTPVAPGVVIFAYNGGTDTDNNASKVLTGPLRTKYTKPADPTRTGYTFAGWDREVSGTFDQALLQINATWKANTYKITYKLDGGTDPKNPTTYTYGVGVTGLKNPTKDGYTFAGWADQKGNLVSGIGAFDTGDKTLTAKWTKNASTDGLNPDGGKVPSDWTGADGQLPIPTRDGYKFDGWFDEDGNQVTTLKDAVGKNLTAKWTKIDDAFDPGDGTLPDDWTGADGELPTPTLPGYKFDGWYDEDGNLVTTVKDAVGKNLHAKWTKIDDAFNPDGGTIPSDWTGEDGELPTPTRDGYRFDGWYDEDGNKVTTLKDAAGKKLTAHWTKLPVTFDVDGDVTIPDDWTGEDGKLPVPTKPGYKFDGWVDEDGNPVTNVDDAAGKKLHPKWTPVDEAFNPDGGTLPDNWTGEDGKLPVPTKPGYKFDGWYDEDGNLITNTEDAAGKKLYPKWTKVEDGFDSDGGNIPSDWTGEDGKLPLPSKPGYKFDGWYDEDGNLITNVEDAVGKKLHAKWASVNDAFDVDGGNLPDGWTGEDGKLPLAYKPGFKFDGWYDEQGNLITSVEDAIGKKLHVKWTSVADAFDANGGNIPADWTGEDGKLPVPTRDGYQFEGWYDDEGNLITNLEDAIGKKLHARWSKVNALASTGATSFAAGLTALALAATGFAASGARRKRSH